jgi:hypothetical protein
MTEETPERNVPRRPPTPVWVKAIAIVGVVIVLVLVIGLLTGVNHGPGMHGG